MLTSFGATTDDRSSAVVIQKDGRIVAAGWSMTAGSGDFALVRYTAAGKLDPSFGQGGKVLTTFDALAPTG